jgi:two-component system chemotaxis sensor kinase CheA
MQVEDSVKIVLKDDGRGLDENKILAKAIEKGLVDKSANLSVDEIRRLIFKPGFSTKDVVSDISGRGVGLDVVSSVISELKGIIDIESEVGKGTEFSISLPSSLSIIKGIVVRVNTELYVLPESQLFEIVDHKKVHLENRSNETKVFTLRNEIIPIISMEKILGQKFCENKKSDRHGLIVQNVSGKVSFEVDEVIGTQSIVLKQLSKELYDLPGIVATTVLGNGEPALVLNLTSLVRTWGL